MPVYYSTGTYSNPLAVSITSRFSVHPAATREPAADHNNVGHRNLTSPTYPHPGCHPFTLCLSCPPPTCKGDLSPKRLNCELRHLRNPFTSHRAAA